MSEANKDISDHVKQDYMEEHKDDNYLFLIFPEEMWEVILPKIKEPFSFINCINASPFFRSRLISGRRQFLFPQLFTILAKQYENNEDDCYDDKLVSKEKNSKNKVWAFPGGLRLVCKPWNQAIEGYYQHHQAHMDLFGYRSFRKGRCKGYLQSDNVRDFMETFKASHASKKNPFFQRSFGTILLAGSYPNRCEDAMRIMSTFGHEIWYASLSIFENFTSSVDFYLWLIPVVQMLPNLKVLELKCHAENRSAIKMDRQIDQLDRAIELNRFPMFEKLKALRFRSLGNVPQRMFREILEQNREVEQVHVRVYDLNGQCSIGEIFNVEFANLSELDISFTCEEDFRQIRELGSSWKLRKFSCNFVKDVTNADLQPIFEMIVDNWRETLEDLGIWLHDSFKQAGKEVLEVTSNYRLELPRLKHFLIKAQTFVSLDFLLPSVQTLRTVDIEDFEKLDFTQECRAYHETKKKQVVQYLGYEHNMKSSNVWKLFKHLESVSKRDFVEEVPEPEFTRYF